MEDITIKEMQSEANDLEVKINSMLNEFQEKYKPKNLDVEVLSDYVVKRTMYFVKLEINF